MSNQSKQRKQVGTGTPGSAGAEAARRDFAGPGDRAPLTEERRDALRESFASRAQLPPGMVGRVAEVARRSAAEAAVRAYEEEWDRLLLARVNAAVEEDRR